MIERCSTCVSGNMLEKCWQKAKKCQGEPLGNPRCAKGLKVRRETKKGSVENFLK